MNHDRHLEGPGNVICRSTTPSAIWRVPRLTCLIFAHRMFIGLSLKILKVAEWVDLIAGVEPFLVVEFSWNIHDGFREFHYIYIIIYI